MNGYVVIPVLLANVAVSVLAVRELRRLRRVRRAYQELHDAYLNMVEAADMLERASVGVVLLGDIYSGERSS
jgi:Flp pilus assembly protein TadB